MVWPERRWYIPSLKRRFRQRGRFRRSRRSREVAKPAICTVMQRRRYSGKALRTHESQLSEKQPGDQEDRQGHPFVGPAGKLLFRALEQAGVDPRQVYLTNAVKHFKFEERGKRRIHQKPNNE